MEESIQTREMEWFLCKFASRLGGLQHEVGCGQRHGRTELDYCVLSSFSLVWFCRNKIANESKAIIPSDMRGTVLSRVDEVERAKETLGLQDTGLVEVLHGVLCRWDGLSLTLMLPTAAGLTRDDNGQWATGIQN